MNINELIEHHKKNLVRDIVTLVNEEFEALKKDLGNGEVNEAKKSIVPDVEGMMDEALKNIPD